MFSRFITGLAVLVCMMSLQDTKAATVAMTFTPNVQRPQAQGNGSYDVYDFFWTSAPGAEFTNYTIRGTASIGAFADPARLQDFRQYNSPFEGNTNGSVDTYANTVMSSAGAEDGGYFPSYSFDPAGYIPSGTGAAPPFTSFIWDVFDTEANDDNDLSNHPDLPVAVAAPYHIARILALPGSGGELRIDAYDTANPGIANVFSFILCCGPGLMVDDLDLGDVTRGNVVTATLPGGIIPSEWTLESFTGPNGAVAGATVDFNTGEFSWDSTGAPLGGYSAVIRDSHFEAGTDTGTLTFNLVPEPATGVLAALASSLLVAGTHRRRS